MTRRAVVLAVCIGLPAHASQPARIGRLDVLAPLPASRIGCRFDMPVSAELRRRGIEKVVSVRDSSTGREIILAITSSGQSRNLTVMMGDSRGSRRESETLFVFFRTNGRVESGHRSATTSGMPARSSEARDSGLLPADTARAVSLARAVRQRCHA
jgi:hypothetical protein